MSDIETIKLSDFLLKLIKDEEDDIELKDKLKNLYLETLVKEEIEDLNK